jgi:hypothetical protein
MFLEELIGGRVGVEGVDVHIFYAYGYWIG